MSGIDHDIREHLPQPLHIPHIPGSNSTMPHNLENLEPVSLTPLHLFISTEQGGVDPTVRLQQWRSPWQVVQYTIQAYRTVRSARRIIRLNQLPALVLD
jgi:hypothetical protein